MRGAFVLEGGRSGTCRKVELLRELKPGFEGAVVEGAEDVDASEWVTDKVGDVGVGEEGPASGVDVVDDVDDDNDKSSGNGDACMVNSTDGESTTVGVEAGIGAGSGSESSEILGIIEVGAEVEAARLLAGLDGPLSNVTGPLMPVTLPFIDDAEPALTDRKPEDGARL